MHSVVKLVAVTAWAMLAHAISIRWAVKHAVFSLEGSLRRVITILFPRLRETSPVARLHSQTLKAKSFPAGGAFVFNGKIPFFCTFVLMTLIVLVSGYHVCIEHGGLS